MLEDKNLHLRHARDQPRRPVGSFRVVPHRPPVAYAFPENPHRPTVVDSPPVKRAPIVARVLSTVSPEGLREAA